MFVESSLNISVNYPLFVTVWKGDAEYAANSIMARLPRSEPIGAGVKPRFPFWFKRIFHHCLSASIGKGWNA